MAAWTFYDYIDEAGSAPFKGWLDALPKDVQAHIDDKLLYLEKRPTWNDKLFKKRKGADGIYELRLTYNKVPYRPLVCRHPSDQRGYVLLAGAIEHNDVLRPTGVSDAAEERRNKLLKDSSRVRLHRF